LGGEQLHHRGLDAARAAGVDLAADVVHQLPRGPDLGGHAGDLEPDRLEVADRLAELDAFLGVGHGVLQRALGQADRAGRRVGAGEAEAEGDALVRPAAALVVAGRRPAATRRPRTLEAQLP